MYQASILRSDQNNLDECLCHMLECINVQDVSSVNLIMESIAQIHYDKVKYGCVKEEILGDESGTFFDDNQKSFLDIFTNSLKSKADYDKNKQNEEILGSTILDLPQHLLFAKYLLSTLRARENKTKLLYTLNIFRAV